MELKMPTETDMDSDLNELFDKLPSEYKLVAGQSALAIGLKMVLEAAAKQVQEEMLNITETDPAVLTSHYVMFRLKNLLLQDMRKFLEYAGSWYIKNVNTIGEEENA